MSRRATKTADPDRVLRAIHEAYGRGYLLAVTDTDGPAHVPGALSGEFQLGVLDGCADRINHGCAGATGDADPVPELRA